MQTNFDYLKNEEKFSTFADVAISAEKIVLIDPEACDKSKFQKYNATILSHNIYMYSKPEGGSYANQL